MRSTLSVKEEELSVAVEGASVAGEGGVALILLGFVGEGGVADRSAVVGNGSLDGVG